jgi:hypothetical protein
MGTRGVYLRARRAEVRSVEEGDAMRGDYDRCHCGAGRGHYDRDHGHYEGRRLQIRTGAQQAHGAAFNTNDGSTRPAPAPGGATGSAGLPAAASRNWLTAAWTEASVSDMKTRRRWASVWV